MAWPAKTIWCCLMCFSAMRCLLLTVKRIAWMALVLHCGWGWELETPTLAWALVFCKQSEIHAGQIPARNNHAWPGLAWSLLQIQLKWPITRLTIAITILIETQIACCHNRDSDVYCGLPVFKIRARLSASFSKFSEFNVSNPIILTFSLRTGRIWDAQRNDSKMSMRLRLNTRVWPMVHEFCGFCFRQAERRYKAR